MLMLLAHGPALAACTTLLDDDLTDGHADGDEWGGSFSGAGWSPNGGTLVYNLPHGVDRGTFTLTLAGLEEAGLSQNDVGEMFTGTDGSFSDGETRSFLQLKMAGDVYDGYAGRIKLQIGGEYGDMELAQWSAERDWSPADTHTITVTWGDGHSTMAHDGAVVAEVDYSPYNGGFVPFQSLRIPNDGRYAYDPAADQLRYTRVTLCGEAGVPPGAPVIDSFDVQPRELAHPAPLTLTWSVSGELTDLQSCGRARTSGELLCGGLSGANGSTSIGSEVLGADTWDVWLEAQGPGGTATSASVVLVVHPEGWTGDDAQDTAQDTARDTATDTGGGPPDDDAGEPDPPGAAAVQEGWGCGCTHGRAGWGWGLAGLLAWRRRVRHGPRGPNPS